MIILPRRQKSRCSVRFSKAEKIFTRNALKAKKPENQVIVLPAGMNGFKVFAKNPE
jgi:hypothetical protein